MGKDGPLTDKVAAVLAAFTPKWLARRMLLSPSMQRELARDGLEYKKGWDRPRPKTGGAA